jgi:hypothetical protein
MLLKNLQGIDYKYEEVILEYSNGHVLEIKDAYLLRLYPERLNGYDAYMEAPLNIEDVEYIEKVTSSRLKKKWKVIGKPQESPIAGLSQDGKSMVGLAPSWRFGLQEV